MRNVDGPKNVYAANVIVETKCHVMSMPHLLRANFVSTRMWIRLPYLADGLIDARHSMFQRKKSFLHE